MSEQRPNNPLRGPHLLAVWPGMGQVAFVAGQYLARTLGAEPLGELEGAEAHFDVDKVQVRDGVVLPARLPSSQFFGWKNPSGGRDLLLFIGEAQPSARSYAFCKLLLDEAQRLGATRVYTFASLVTPQVPGAPSRVSAIATRPDLLQQVRRGARAVAKLETGQIGGLNGTLLAAAAERGLEGVGLLGEVPQIAAGVPYMKASQAVLEVFAQLTGVEVDLADLSEQAASVERGLVDLVGQLKEAAAERKGEEEPDWAQAAADHDDGGEADGSDREPAGPRLEPEDHARIEELFLRAEADRSVAIQLKELLDDLRVFPHYEDRFLDLFRRSA